MSAKRTIQRDHWLITCGGERVTVARSEHSDWVEIQLADVHLLIADLREIAETASPRRSMAEIFAHPEGESER